MTSRDPYVTFELFGGDGAQDIHLENKGWNVSFCKCFDSVTMEGHPIFVLCSR